MKPKVKQYGLMPEFDGEDPADYTETMNNPLNRLVLLEIKDAGSRGATSKEIARKIGRPYKSVSGRFTELYNVGKIQKLGSLRNGEVYVVKGD